MSSFKNKLFLTTGVQHRVTEKMQVKIFYDNYGYG